MKARCPRVGTRVTFAATPAASMLYAGGPGGPARTPDSGEGGSVTAIPVPGGTRTCMPGPRGGMVYVDWDGGGTSGVFREDLEFGRGRRRHPGRGGLGMWSVEGRCPDGRRVGPSVQPSKEEARDALVRLRKKHRGCRVRMRRRR